MNETSSFPRWMGVALIPTAALALLLPGCEHFRRIKQPVTTSPREYPQHVQPPTHPVPPPRPEQEPEPEPMPPVVKPPAGPRPTAMAVPGKAGFVFSPYNNNLIDVQGFAPGTLVADPTYPASERKHFRVP